MNKRKLGTWYEDLASCYIKSKGGHIIHRNFRIRSGELDIVATDGEYLCFIEVKYRKDKKYGGPEAAVNYAKQKKISYLSRLYLSINHIPDDIPLRYDVIAISGEDNAALVKWIKNAFEYCA